MRERERWGERGEGGQEREEGERRGRKSWMGEGVGGQREREREEVIK